MERNMFNQGEAMAYIKSRMAESNSKLSTEELQAFVEKAAAFENEYMQEMGFYDEEQTQEELVYDEEDSFHYILSGFHDDPRYKGWKDDILEDLIDDYLEHKYDYLLSKGLVE